MGPKGVTKPVSFSEILFQASFLLFVSANSQSGIANKVCQEHFYLFTVNVITFT